MISLGREPQVPGVTTPRSPRRGRQILAAASAAASDLIFLSPLRGFPYFFFSRTWGSRPRLSILRRSAARHHVTTFR